jgi:hypothetical protein
MAASQANRMTLFLESASTTVVSIILYLIGG